MNIAYINENQERLYDNYMLRETLRVSKPKLQKLLGQYKFSPGDYVILDFISFLFRSNRVTYLNSFLKSN